MIAKKAVLEIFQKNINYREVFKKSLIHRATKKRKDKSLKIQIDNIDDIKIHVRNKNLFIVVHGEEVYVKLMILPKVSREKLYFIIKQELRVRFKNLDNIMFTYEVFQDNGNCLEVIVFCFNWNEAGLVKNCIETGGDVKGIYPIQFCILDKYRNQIKSENYILIFYLKNNVYLIGCYRNKIVGNSVFRNFDIDNTERFEDEIDSFIVKCNILSRAKELPSIFLLNFFNKALIESLRKNYNCESLGEIDYEDSIKKVILNEK